LIDFLSREYNRLEKIGHFRQTVGRIPKIALSKQRTFFENILKTAQTGEKHLNA
jgi:hypothetical protein